MTLYSVLFLRPCCFHSFLNSLDLEIGKNKHGLRVHSTPNFHVHYLTSLSVPPVGGCGWSVLQMRTLTLISRSRLNGRNLINP